MGFFILLPVLGIFWVPRKLGAFLVLGVWGNGEKNKKSFLSAFFIILPYVPYAHIKKIKKKFTTEKNKVLGATENFPKRNC